MLYQGDCLHLPDSLQCDLVYLDPPFFTQTTLYGPYGSFNDTWPSFEAYLEWLQARIKKVASFLTRYGSIFIHLDRRSVHYIKVWLDRFMGRDRFRNEIIWHYTGGGRGKHYFSHKHDTILWYSMDPLTWTFNIDAVRTPYKKTSGYAKSGIKGQNGKTYLPHALGTPVDDVWEIPMNLRPANKEARRYWEAIDDAIVVLTGTTLQVLQDYKQQEAATINSVGQEGITYWREVIESYKSLSQEEAVERLIVSEKIYAKIKTIQAVIKRHP